MNHFFTRLKENSTKLTKLQSFCVRFPRQVPLQLQSLVPLWYFYSGFTGMTGFCTGPNRNWHCGTREYHTWYCLRRSTQYRYKGFRDSVVVLQLQSFCGNTRVTDIDSTLYSTQQDSTYVQSGVSKSKYAYRKNLEVRFSSKTSRREKSFKYKEKTRTSTKERKEQI